jgi:anionic cell wall polymer biosynthesis LytR-Cps2A-Psr (LCP) family protein
MARQKCVMNAMLQQLSPEKVVLKFEKIAKASEDLITTNVPLSEVDRFVELALKARSKPVRTVSFVPPMVSTSRPDIDKIHQAVQDALHPKKKAKKAAGPRTPVNQGTTGGAIGSMHAGYAANQAEDLGSAC